MQTTDKTAVELVHRLLFRALIEMRAQGHEQKSKLVFHLADLFHNVVLDMEAAAEGKLTYDEVLRQLEEKAKEKNCERWLLSARTQIEITQTPLSDG
jgi:Mg/Co/Ni transporter MgtE